MSENTSARKKKICKLCGAREALTQCDNCSVDMCQNCEAFLSLEVKNGKKGCVECED